MKRDWYSLDKDYIKRVADEMTKQVGQHFQYNPVIITSCIILAFLLAVPILSNAKALYTLSFIFLCLLILFLMHFSFLFRIQRAHLTRQIQPKPLPSLLFLSLMISLVLKLISFTLVTSLEKDTLDSTLKMKPTSLLIHTSLLLQ